ncbi:OmpA/MotB family protein [Litchfieldella xinjiangensis]|uniref:OmpA/MotB family protein n=1 Tax=Litchfieldella xinjiangensis TaxID=1166948 RepID=UPI0005BDEAD3|nr:OmpA family protein [Halomonas xinjiangensis]
MLDRHSNDSLLPGASDGGEADESWLMSYLDVLTLLITLFVLLLSLAGNGLSSNGEATAGISEGDRQGGSSTSVAPRGSGILPRDTGLAPRFRDLRLEGIDVAQGKEGVTLRIADHLLFPSGSADLTRQGREVLDGLIVPLNQFEGRISVEGHSDDVPIATARFPSNWELSSARAIAVLRFLAEVGLDASRLRAIGYADTLPLEANATPEGRSANRRVELVLHEPTP